MVWPFGGRRGRFERLHVVRVVHEGEKSVVYLAESSGSASHRAAVKLYRPQYDQLAHSLEQKYGIPSEAEMGMQLNPRTPAEVEHHPLVVTKSGGREFGRRNGCRYIVLEFVEGVTLKSLISVRDPRVWKGRVAFAADCCRALRVIHEAGFVCRDFCSQNLIFQPNGRLKLVDLGFVAPAGVAYAERSGTPGYMSPEQVRAEELTPASDIYSLGIVLYEMLTGRLPYVSDIRGDDPQSLEARRQEGMRMHLERPVPELPPEVARRSARLAAVATRCLQKDPPGRFQSVDELLGYLRSGS